MNEVKVINYKRINTTRKVFRFTFTVCILVLALTISADSREVNKSAGTTAFTFMKINSGARAVAMGTAFTGLADDENALYYNPAGIATLDRSGVILGYNNYFVGLQSGVVGGVWKFRRKYTLGASLFYLNYGTFVQTDNTGNRTGEFGGSDLMLSFTLAAPYSESFFVGLTTKLIYEKIQEFSATGVAIDLGAKYRSNRGRFTAGVAIQHLGAQLSSFTNAEKDGLPTLLRLGAGYRLRGLPVQFVGDIIIPTDNDAYIALGGEYYEFKSLRLRMGWNSFGKNRRASSSDDRSAGLTLGLGFLWNKKELSYALAPGAELGDSHRITITGEI